MLLIMTNHEGRGELAAVSAAQSVILIALMSRA